MNIKEQILENSDKKAGIYICSKEENNAVKVTIYVEGYFRKWEYLEKRIKDLCTKKVILKNCNLNDLERLKYYNFWTNQNYYFKKVDKPIFIHLNFSKMSNKHIKEDVFKNFYMIKSIQFGKKLKSIGAGAFNNLQNCQKVSFPKNIKLHYPCFLLLGRSYNDSFIKKYFGEFNFSVFYKETNNIIFNNSILKLKPFIEANTLYKNSVKYEVVQ